MPELKGRKSWYFQKAVQHEARMQVQEAAKHAARMAVLELQAEQAATQTVPKMQVLQGDRSGNWSGRRSGEKERDRERT